MKHASKTAAWAAALLLAVSPAIAQDSGGESEASGGNTSALDSPPGVGEPISATNPDMMMTEGAFSIFFEDDGTTMRSEEDAMTMFNEASPEDQEMAMMACEDWEEERVAFLDSVSSLCRAFSDTPQ
jgi:hypothetical protein